jgi:hypothetical protein
VYGSGKSVKINNSPQLIPFRYRYGTYSVNLVLLFIKFRKLSKATKIKVGIQTMAKVVKMNQNWYGYLQWARKVYAAVAEK